MQNIFSWGISSPFGCFVPRRSVLHGSPVVVFLADRGHPCFWNFYSAVPIDVIRAKSYVNCSFDLRCVVMRNTINKLNFVPERLMSGVVVVL